MLTRRRLLNLFGEIPISRESDEIELVRSLRPIASRKAPAGSSEDSLERYLVRQSFINDRLKPQDLEALGLLICSRRQLFRFLEAVTSPDARNGSEQVDLATKIDALLRLDGYTIIRAGQISGSPFYSAQLMPSGSPADDSISATLAVFDPTQVHARWTMAMERRSSEPAGAITLARTLLEDVFKWILDEAGESWQEVEDLPVLYRRLAKVLKLAPDDHTEQVFKQILGSCQSIVESLGALRNKLSDAHSPGPKRARPQARHAELAVNLAGTMATFIVATWEARRIEKNADQGPTTSSQASEGT